MSRAAWAHDFNSNQSITASFQSLPASSVVLNGKAAAVEAAFESEFSDIVTTVGGRGTLRYNW